MEHTSINMEKQMTQLVQDLRKQTLDLVLSGHTAGGDQKMMASLIDVWLASLEEDELTGITPDSLPATAVGSFSTTRASGNPTVGRFGYSSWFSHDTSLLFFDFRCPWRPWCRANHWQS